MELKDTVELMNSKDYKERFKAEYLQAKIRYDKLVKEEKCSKCNKDIDCKITQDINGKLKCTED